MKLRITTAVTALFIGLLSNSSVGANANYGMAGCGLGSMLFKGQNGKEQIFVATTNNFSASQTFGITTGTSQCTDTPATTAAMFISINQVALRKEAARGEGETIKGLATILSCKDTALFAENMQKNYGEIFSKETNSSIEIVKAIGETVKGNANLHNTCGAI